MRKAIILLLLLFCYTGHAAVVVGNPRGSITLTEVFDYQCVHCHRMYPVILQLMRQYPNLKVRLLPVAVINNNSLPEAAVAIAATAYPNKFQQFTSITMSVPPLSVMQINRLCQRLNLTDSKFQALIHSQAVKQQLLEGLALLHTYNAKGVPLFVIYPSNNPQHKIVLHGEQSAAVLIRAIRGVR